MNPIDIVLSCLGQLTEAEKQRVREALDQTLCSSGHKFKIAGETRTWLLFPKYKLFCEKCGKVELV